MARLVAARGGLANVRVLFAIATHEEIGRFGPRVLAGHFAPDVLIGVDVSHDFVAAPGVGDKRFTPVAMGKGFSLAIGSIVSEQLNAIVQRACTDAGVPFQKVVVGRDTGTDAMAGFFAAIDAASTSIGFPIRNMHTISELAHTGDVLAAIHGLEATLTHMDAANGGKGLDAEALRRGHPRLDQVEPLAPIAPEALEDDEDEKSADGSEGRGGE